MLPFVHVYKRIWCNWLCKWCAIYLVLVSPGCDYKYNNIICFSMVPTILTKSESWIPETYPSRCFYEPTIVLTSYLYTITQLFDIFRTTPWLLPVFPCTMWLPEGSLWFPLCSNMTTGCQLSALSSIDNAEWNKFHWSLPQLWTQLSLPSTALSSKEPLPMS